MTIPRDEVVRMAREAGIDLVDGEIYGSTNGAVFAFATLIRERTIEECAAVCDEARDAYLDNNDKDDFPWDAIEQCAAAIRAMKGEQPPAPPLPRCSGGHDWRQVIDCCKGKPCEDTVLGRKCARCGEFEGAKKG